MLFFYRHKEDAIVIIFENERIKSVIKWQNGEERLCLSAKNISTRIHTDVLDNKRENTESWSIIYSTTFDAQQEVMFLCLLAVMGCYVSELHKSNINIFCCKLT